MLDDLSTGHAERIAGLPGVTLIEGDIRDPGTVAEAVEGCGCIAHLAARISVAETVRNPRQAFAVNVTGTRNVFAAAGTAGVERVAFASSAAVYGDAPTSPQHEDDPTAPLSPYGEQKLEGERLAAAAVARGGLCVLPLRYFNVYGPGQGDGGPYAAVIAAFARQLCAGLPLEVHGDGLQTRDFVHVSDVVRANLAALSGRADRLAGVPINVASGVATSVLQLGALLASRMGVQPALRFCPGRPGDVRHSVADVRRAFEHLGWRAEVPLADGLRTVLDGGGKPPGGGTS